MVARQTSGHFKTWEGRCMCAKCKTAGKTSRCAASAWFAGRRGRAASPARRRCGRACCKQTLKHRCATPFRRAHGVLPFSLWVSGSYGVAAFSRSSSCLRIARGAGSCGARLLFRLLPRALALLPFLRAMRRMRSAAAVRSRLRCCAPLRCCSHARISAHCCGDFAHAPDSSINLRLRLTLRDSLSLRTYSALRHCGASARERIAVRVLRLVSHFLRFAVRLGRCRLSASCTHASAPLCGLSRRALQGTTYRASCVPGTSSALPLCLSAAWRACFCCIYSLIFSASPSACSTSGRETARFHFQLYLTRGLCTRGPFLFSRAELHLPAFW